MSTISAFRSYLLAGAAPVGLAPGMMAAEFAEKKNRIEDWIAAHPEQSRQISKSIEVAKWKATGSYVWKF